MNLKQYKSLDIESNRQEAEICIRQLFKRRLNYKADTKLLIYYNLRYVAAEFLDDLVGAALKNKMFWEAMVALIFTLDEKNIPLTDILKTFKVIVLTRHDLKPKYSGTDPLVNFYRNFLFYESVQKLEKEGFCPTTKNDATSDQNSIFKVVSDVFFEFTSVNLSPDAIRKIRKSFSLSKQPSYIVNVLMNLYFISSKRLINAMYGGDDTDPTTYITFNFHSLEH